ncbi:hypothetical protein LTR94_021806 [Friedmanniomyces endolithicus]|nr:hypothetical protein LTR94_021806 [Friedmanniomyces endolithicus]
MACLKSLVLSAHKHKCKKDPVQMLVQLKAHVANRLVLVVANHVSKVVAAHKVSTLHVANVGKANNMDLTHKLVETIQP